MLLALLTHWLLAWIRRSLVAYLHTYPAVDGWINMARTASFLRQTLLWLLVVCLGLVLLTAPVSPLLTTVQAQEGETDNKSAEGPARMAEKPKHSFRDLFIHILDSVGWIFGLTLLIVSIALLSIVVLLTMELRMGSAIPAAFVEDFTDTVNKRKFKEAYEMAKEENSYLGRVLTTGMSRLQYGIEDAREAAYATVETIRASKEQLVTYLATIGTLGPLLGLVGTVWGMILSFLTLKKSTGGVNAQQIADDISHALVVTLLGIGLSVPAIFFHAYFRNRLIRLSHETANVADDLLTQMYHNSKKQGPSAAVADAADPRSVPSTATRQGR